MALLFSKYLYLRNLITREKSLFSPSTTLVATEMLDFDEAAHMLKATSGDTCSAVRAVRAVTCLLPKADSPSMAESGTATACLHNVICSFQWGLLETKACAHAGDATCEGILDLEPVDSKNGQGLMNRKWVTPDCFCLCVLWLELRQELRP